MAAKFTVCALFYGDHSDLARRLLSSLRRSEWPQDILYRFGINNVCSETLKTIEAFYAAYPGRVDVLRGFEPYYKYPLMRRMYENLLTPYAMWFDDDSWIGDGAPNTWFDDVEAKLQTCELVGAPYTMKLRGNQQQFIKDQPWYTGKPISNPMTFATGGWLAACSEVYNGNDWPPASFEHNGGDVMLGAMCEQQGYRIGKFTQHIGINADDSMKCSSAPRRGANTTPIGVNYTPSQLTPEQRKEVIKNGWGDPPPPKKSFFDILDGK